MAVPKKKVSRSRRNMRRFAGGNKLRTVSVHYCPQCGELARMHHVCGHCGFYNGRKVLQGLKAATPKESSTEASAEVVA
jgi:large subunit ribosomal protein L32